MLIFLLQCQFFTDINPRPVHLLFQFIDDLCFVGFALFNVVWATLYLEDWKRRSAELAFKWGTLDKKDELLEDPRPLFTV